MPQAQIGPAHEGPRLETSFLIYPAAGGVFASRNHRMVKHSPPAQNGRPRAARVACGTPRQARGFGASKPTGPTPPIQASVPAV
jgi:hypothetical protein